MRQINCVAFIWCKFTWPAGDQLPKDSFHKEWIYESPPLSPLVFGGCPDHLRFLDSLIILDSRSMPGNKQIALVFICQALVTHLGWSLALYVTNEQHLYHRCLRPTQDSSFQFLFKWKRGGDKCVGSVGSSPSFFISSCKLDFTVAVCQANF